MKFCDRPVKPSRSNSAATRRTGLVERALAPQCRFCTCSCDSFEIAVTAVTAVTRPRKPIAEYDHVPRVAGEDRCDCYRAPCLSW